MFTNQPHCAGRLVATSVRGLGILAVLAVGASSAFAQDCVRDPAWICDGDVDGDGAVNPVDVGLVMSAFGSTNEASLCQYDVDCDGTINPVDAGLVMSLFGTCEEPRAVCGGEEPSLDDLFFFVPDDDVIEFVTIHDEAFLAGIVYGDSNRPHTIYWSTNNGNVSVDPPESEVYFDPQGDVFSLTFTVHSGQDEAFTLTGEVVGPDWQGAVEQDVALFQQVPLSDCKIKVKVYQVDRRDIDHFMLDGAVTSNPVIEKAKTGNGRKKTVTVDDAGQLIVVIGRDTEDPHNKMKYVYRCDPDVCDNNGDTCEGQATMSADRKTGTLPCDC